SGARNTGSATRRSMPNLMVPVDSYWRLSLLANRCPPRSTAGQAFRRDPRWEKFVREAIEMMEVRLARRMRQGPVRLTAARVLGDHGEAETPAGIARQVGEPVQLERGLQRMAVRRRLLLDRGAADLRRDAHPVAMAVEPIGGPLGRG